MTSQGMRTLVRALSTLLLLASGSRAQPTMEVLQRVVMIESRFGRGTAFSLDVDHREYWITARHVLTGAKGKPFGTTADKMVTLKLLSPDASSERWVEVKFAAFFPEADVDVAVLVPPANLLPPGVLSSPKASADGVAIGGACQFLGFPYGGGWIAPTSGGASVWLPYVKRCEIAGMDIDSRLWILDGINNPGFSGGPVVYQLGGPTNIAVMAVVSGYRTEPAEVIRGDARLLNAPKDTVSLNSGFILAYDIEHALKVIKKHPIGPPRAAPSLN